MVFLVFLRFMSNDGSVTAWLPLLERGDAGADEWLVSTYFEQVARIARRQLGLAPRRTADEEDVANSVFRLFLARAKDGGFKQLADRNDLHRILLLLTKRRAIDYYRRAMRRRQLEVGESALAEAMEAPVRFEEIATTQAPSDLVTEIAEEIRELFSDIECQDLQLDQIAMLRLQGYSAAEIADRIGCLPRTVYRRLNLIQTRWQSRADAGQAATGKATDEPL